MVASAKVYTTNKAQTKKDLKMVQMGPGGTGTGYFDNNGNYHGIQNPSWGDITHTPDHMIETANDMVDTIRGKDREQERAEGATEYGFYYGTNTGLKPIYNPAQIQEVPTTKATGGYSRTTAKTAKDIAQGGMTKQEVQEFNMKHPNETVMRGQ